MTVDFELLYLSAKLQHWACLSSWGSQPDFTLKAIRKTSSKKHLPCSLLLHSSLHLKHLAQSSFKNTKTHLGDIEVSIPDPCHKASITIKQVAIFLLVEGLATPIKYNKAKCNKMRYVCTFTHALSLLKNLQLPLEPRISILGF